MNKPYDYFICYKGEDGINANSFAKEFAFELFNTLESCGKRVYFAPVNGQGDRYNDRDWVQKTISELTTSIIVLLTPGFFDEFECGGEKTLQKEINTAIETAKRKDNEQSGFIKYVRFGFKWSAPVKYYLENKKIFDFEKYSFDKYFDISSYIPSGKDVKEDVNNYMKKYLGIDVDREESIRVFRRDMEDSFHCVVSHAQSFYLNELETFAEKDDSVKENYEKFDSVLNKLNLYSTDKKHTPLCYWPIFFTDLKNFNKETPSDEELRKFRNSDFTSAREFFNVCATSFGALQILQYDNKKDVPAYTQAYFDEILRGTRNLVAAMRSFDYNNADNQSVARWPQEKRLNDVKDSFDIDEGLNHTTISVSCLLKSGFLPENSEGQDKAVLEERFNFLLSAIRWLMTDAPHTDDQENFYWNIGAGDNQIQKGSALMTAMALDTIIKFYRNKYVWTEHVEEVTKLYHNQTVLFLNILQFFESIQNDDGGIRPSLDNPESSFSHTAKSLISLITFWEFSNDEKMNVYSGNLKTCRKIAEEIIVKGFVYLCKMLISDKSALYDETKQQDYEKFNIPCSADGKVKNDYEMSGELMTVTAISKVLHYIETNNLFMSKLKNLDFIGEGNELSVDIRINMLKNKLVDFLNFYRKGHVKTFYDISATTSIMVKGCRDSEELHYPVYILYYYRMAVESVLKLIVSKD